MRPKNEQGQEEKSQPKTTSNPHSSHMAVRTNSHGRVLVWGEAGHVRGRLAITTQLGSREMIPVTRRKSGGTAAPRGRGGSAARGGARSVQLFSPPPLPGYQQHPL